MKYEVNNGMVVREDGYVALQHRTSNPAVVKVGDTTYRWTPRLNVSLEWVHPDHLTRLLNETAKVCCGKSGKKFFMASYINVNLWTNGTREYQG